jgi:prevent-host-death family protein
VEQIAVSKFKATCLSVLERVRKTRKPILVTRFGKPIAEVVPPSTPEHPVRQLGAMTGTVSFIGDIVSPGDDDDWEVLR